ncbi:MAG: hypothetical protein ACOYEW_07585 [Anaerolineae bacterium]
MLRRTSVVAIVGLLFALMASQVSAQGTMPVEPAVWTGGNGWCSEGVCFRAWPGPDGVEVTWRVESKSAGPLVVMRLQLQPVLEATPAPLAQSGCLGEDCSGEFSYLDKSVVPGALYRYELVSLGEFSPLGDPLEAGVAAQAVDPGGSGRSYQVYLPLTLSH